MHPLVVVALLQLFFAILVANRGTRRPEGGTYLPMGIAMLGITFAAMALATPA